MAGGRDPGGGGPGGGRRVLHSIAQIRDMLALQAEAVALRYAPPVAGAWWDKGGWWTCNPGRGDRKPGSFVVWVHGPRAGNWHDFATGEGGDLIDLIRLFLGCSLVDALREARRYLGLEHEAPEDVRAREAAAAKAAERRQAAAKADAKAAARKSRLAFAMWLAAREKIAGGPVEWYLRDARGIDLAALGRQPRALRFDPECRYQHTDPETGEVIEGAYPAMLALVTDGHGQPVAVHRTWLAADARGRWGKAPVPKAKKVFGRYVGGAIHLWRGIGPRGGKPAPLRQAPPGTHVWLAEGIEDALSAVVLMPEARVLAAVSLSNLGAVVLPPAVTVVTLIADRDESEGARRALDRAVAAHAEAGREVRLWRNRGTGKDLNDALRAAMSRREAGPLSGGAA